MSAEEEKKEEPTKVADAEAPVEEKETKEVKVVKRPDETVMKEKIAVEEEKMSKLQEKLSAIKEQLDKNDSSRPDANSELGIAKAKFNTAKSESRRVQQEKRNIYDQISAADELRQQQQDLVTRLRTELQVFSVDEIERKIKQLEHKQQTTSLTIKEDKAIMEEIKKLSSGKPKIQTFKDAQDSLTGIKEHHNTLYTSLKAKNAELAIAKEAEDKVRAVMDEVRSREDAKKPDLPKLFKERDELRSSINEHRSAIRKIQNEFNAEKKEFYEYLKVVREQKNKEYNERKAAKQAEWDEYKKLLEAEEAKRDPWEEEKAICEQLIAWVQRLLPKQSGPAVEKVEIDHGSFKVMKKDEDEEMFAGLGKKKGKNKKKSVGGEAGPAAPPKSQKMKHSFDDLAVWKKLSIEAPQETGDLPAMLETLRAKQEWLKTAPPKPKKVDKAEKKGDKAEKKAEVALAEGEVVYADEMQKHLTSILHGVLAAAPADPYKEMYKGCFAASLLEGGGEVTASTMTLTSEHEAYVKKFSLQMHIDTCIAKKAKGTGPKGPFKFMMSDASDFFTDLSKKLKASGGVPTDTSMTAEELAAKDKADAEARRQKDAAAEAERDRIDAENAKRTAEMEQSGKKVSGGLHKFDASEVDINGGDATADDFMDAFGF